MPRNKFEEWEKEQWARVPLWMAKYLCAYLLANGVFVNTNDNQITANLERIAKQPFFCAWTADEINAQIGQNIKFSQNVENPELATNIQTANKPWHSEPIQIPLTPLIPLPHGHTSGPWLPEHQHQEQHSASSPIPLPISRSRPNPPSSNLSSLSQPGPNPGRQHCRCPYIGYTKLAAGIIYQRQHRNDPGGSMGVIGYRRSSSLSPSKTSFL
ncbi:MAG: hypothetical protein M1840_007879 [Geoglossum simile]|nr:MAG: hypothetical protein M1840_007879 [Geoglossum simile]